MYTIYADDVCIYNDLAADQSVRLIAPTVSWEDNAAGTLTFTMPECNVGYNTLVLMSSFIVVKKNDKEIWWGRPIKETKDFWKNRAVTCEGALAFLNDVKQPLRVYEEDPARSITDTRITDEDEYTKTFNGYPNAYITELIRLHNLKSSYKFKIGTINVTKKMVDEDDNDEFYEYVVVRVDNKNTLEAISEKLTNNEKIEGHIYVSGRDSNGYFILNYLKDPIVQSTQTVEFGKNLLDFTVGLDDTQFCTVLYPRGQQQDEVADGINDHEELVTAVPEREYTNPDDGGVVRLQIVPPYVVNNQGKAVYGWIEKSMDFTEAKDEAELRDKAIEWMTKHRFKDMEINIKAFDLAYMDVDYEQIEFFQNVRIISLPHSLDMLFPVLNVSIPMDQPQNATYTLGKKKVANLSTYSSSVQKDVDKNKELADIDLNALSNRTDRLFAEERIRIDKKILGMQAEIEQEIADTREEITNYIKSPTKGRITFDKNANGYQTAMIIADITDSQVDNFDYKSSTKPMWIWNYNGLGFFPNGPKGDKDVSVGITNQGKIIANDIAADTITANMIKAGQINTAHIDTLSIKAEWIETDYLTVKHVLATGTSYYIDEAGVTRNFDISTSVDAGNITLKAGYYTAAKLQATYATNTNDEHLLMYVPYGQVIISNKDNPNAPISKYTDIYGNTYYPKLNIDGALAIGNKTNNGNSAIFFDTISGKAISTRVSSYSFTQHDHHGNEKDKEEYPPITFDGLVTPFLGIIGGIAFTPSIKKVYEYTNPIYAIDCGKYYLDECKWESGVAYTDAFWHYFGAPWDNTPMVFVSIMYDAPGDKVPILYGFTAYAHTITPDGFHVCVCNNGPNTAAYLTIAWLAIGVRTQDGGANE